MESRPLGDCPFEGAYSFPSRFEEGKGTNPEELLGAAHAACFSMALAGALSAAGHTPGRVSTKATVHIERVEAGFAVTRIDLATEASVPGLDAAAFQSHAQDAK